MLLLLGEQSAGRCVCCWSAAARHLVASTHAFLTLAAALCPFSPTVLDTADPESRAAFLKSHSELVEGVVALSKRVQVRNY